VSLIAHIANPNRLGHKIRLACASCKWSASIALVAIGLILIALATYALCVSLIGDWQSGWIARVIGLIAFCSVPLVFTFVAREFVGSRDKESLRTRLAWAGAFATLLGLLELILAVGSLELSWTFYSMGNH